MIGKGARSKEVARAIKKYGGIYLPKVGYDIEKVAQFFADKMMKK